MLISVLSIIGGFISRRTKGHAVIWDALLPIAQQRCKERQLAAQGHTVPTHVRTLFLPTPLSSSTQLSW